MNETILTITDKVLAYMYFSKCAEAVCLLIAIGFTVGMGVAAFKFLRREGAL